MIPISHRITRSLGRVTSKGKLTAIALLLSFQSSRISDCVLRKDSIGLSGLNGYRSVINRKRHLSQRSSHEG
jgi:hypothetical protein